MYWWYRQNVVKWVILFLRVNFEVQRSFLPRKPLHFRGDPWMAPSIGQSKVVLRGEKSEFFSALMTVQILEGMDHFDNTRAKSSYFWLKNSSQIKEVPFAAKIWIKRDESTFVTYSWFESHTSNWIMGHWKVKRSFFMFFLVLFAGFSYSDILMWLHFSRYEFKMRYTE